ncbi:Circadian clock protein kinase KaiC [uncultured archaeon]|nr:Circadian clock protein kinase KaiC [uncultured archaeon]
MSADRIKTGIKTLDEILDGGIPKGHVILVAGSCGTGKTTLVQQILFDGAKNNNEVGIYISMSEEREKLIRNLEGFTFFDKKLIDTGQIRIIDISQDARLMGINMQNVQGLLNLIRSVVEENNAKRVVIDSITALCEALKEPEKIRDFIFELGMQLAYSGCTTFLISEIPPQTFVYSVFGIEEFISDGVLLLTEFERKGELLRALQVIKMRGVKHSRNKYVLKILEDGINLVPMFKAGEV